MGGRHSATRSPFYARPDLELLERRHGYCMRDIRMSIFASYFALDGDLAGGPLLPPGLPGIFEASCVDVLSFTSEPVVPGRFAAGPLLLPGWP